MRPDGRVAAIVHLIEIAPAVESARLDRRHST
jgi:hypothetical protein